MSAQAGRARGGAPARPDAVRRHNLGRLLTEIHRDGELTRAELTARLGLNRSTIATLVGELVGSGLLDNSPPDASARSEISAGRPSHRVRPRCDGPYVLAVDVEVDRVAVAAVGVGGRVLRREDRPAATGSPARAARAVADLLERTAADVGGSPVGIGVSVPGSVDRDSDLVLRAPNLNWCDVGFGPLLSAALRTPELRGLPVRVGNDANLGAVAERLRGTARHDPNLVFLLGRIGVGAGIVADTHLLTGYGGAAGEVGHLCLAADGPPCHCGNRGCAEVYIGDAALLAAAGRPGEPTREAVSAVLDDAEVGDARALAGVRQVAHDLGRTVAVVVNLINPSLVVTGGTLARVVEIAGEETRAVVARYAFGRAADASTVRASSILVTDSCLLGAAELAFAPLLADPAAFAAASALA